MEAKLREAIGSQDWYSAHQLLISLAQRKQRSKKHAEARALLASGLKDMCPVEEGGAWPPLATVLDIGSKYVEVCAAEESLDYDDESVEVEGSIIFRSCLMACDKSRSTPDAKHSCDWADISSKLLTRLPSLVPICKPIILESSVPADWKASWAVEHLAGRKEEWGSVAGSFLAYQFDDRLVAVTVCQLLARKSFGSAAELLGKTIAWLKEHHQQSVTFSPIDDSTGNLPSFCCFVDSPTLQCTLLNLAQLVFILCQRKSPGKQYFAQLKKQYKLMGEGDELGMLVDVLERVFALQPKKMAEPMNPLASMFQNMFSAPPPPPQTSAKKSSRKTLDLD